jgi:flagellar hook-basal body protein
MGLSGARNSSVTGLQAQSTAISIAADNIANASTPGYKAITGQFSTLVTNTTTGTGFSSGGVNVNAKNIIEKQGLIETTGRTTDLAISGNGFFAVQDESGSLLLTRAGSFDINNKGELVNPEGLQLLGWPLDNDGRKPGATGNLNTTAAESTSSLEIVDTNAASGTASATTTITTGLNLNSGQSVFQGATINLNPDSLSVNGALAQEDIVVPVTGTQKGDSFTLTANSLDYTFEYGGFAESGDVGTSSIFGASTTATTFTAGTDLVDGDQFTVTTVSSGAVTFTYRANNPSTGIGEFNSLDTLAQAIDATTGLTARTSGGQLFVSSVDATEAITFGDVSSSNLHNELGFSNQLAAASGVLRWNTFEGLAELANAQADVNALINNPTSGANIEMFAADPQNNLTVTKIDNVVTADLRSDENGEISSTSLIVPVNGTAMAAGDTVVFEDDQAGGGNSITATYGGFETSDTISSANAMYAATDTTTAFSGAGIANADTLTIDDGGGATTFTFTTGTPDTSAGTGEFNSLATLAEAIQNSTDYIARVENDTLYVSAVDAELGLTFANGGGNTADFLTDLGLSNVAAGGAGTFNTMAQLQAIIDGDGNFSATIANTSANSSVSISSATSTTGIVVGDSADDLIAELGIADNHNVGDEFFAEMNITGTAGVAATAQSNTIALTYDASDSTKNMAGGNISPHFPRNIEVFDALGTGHDFRLSFLKIGTNEWAVEFYALDPTEIVGSSDGLLVSGTVAFNGDGSLNNVSSSLAGDITIPWTTGSVDNTISFDFGTAGQPANTVGASVIGLTDGIRQFDAAYSVEFIEQNGVAAGLFKGITVDDDGTVNANFSNGEIKPIYKLPILTVANQNALSPQTGNTFSVTQDSGEVNLKDAGRGDAGTIVAGSLEGSTADIAEELTRTIGIQSNYNANATLISTVRDMEEELNRRL